MPKDTYKINFDTIRKNNKRVILCGPGASGKDFFKEYLGEMAYNKEVSYTSRRPRKGEVDGEHYNFVSAEEFEKLIHKDFFYDWIDFNTNGKYDGPMYYGTSNKGFYESQVMIMTPSGIEQLAAYDRERSLIVYFDIPVEVRYQRLLDRNSKQDPADIRIQSDTEKFEGFEDFDLRVVNPEFSKERLEYIINELIYINI